MSTIKACPVLQLSAQGKRRHLSREGTAALELRVNKVLRLCSPHVAPCAAVPRVLAFGWDGIFVWFLFCVLDWGGYVTEPMFSFLLLLLSLLLLLFLAVAAVVAVFCGVAVAVDVVARPVLPSVFRSACR